MANGSHSLIRENCGYGEASCSAIAAGVTKQLHQLVRQLLNHSGLHRRVGTIVVGQLIDQPIHGVQQRSPSVGTVGRHLHTTIHRQRKDRHGVQTWSTVKALPSGKQRESCKCVLVFEAFKPICEALHERQIRKRLGCDKCSEGIVAGLMHGLRADIGEKHEQFASRKNELSAKRMRQANRPGVFGLLLVFVFSVLQLKRSASLRHRRFPSDINLSFGKVKGDDDSRTGSDRRSPRRDVSETTLRDSVKGNSSSQTHYAAQEKPAHWLLKHRECAHALDHLAPLHSSPVDSAMGAAMRERRALDLNNAAGGKGKGAAYLPASRPFDFVFRVHTGGGYTSDLRLFEKSEA